MKDCAGDVDCRLDFRLRRVVSSAPTGRVIKHIRGNSFYVFGYIIQLLYRAATVYGYTEVIILSTHNEQRDSIFSDSKMILQNHFVECNDDERISIIKAYDASSVIGRFETGSDGKVFSI